jgi:membrane-associated phospholipid phosphatase
MSAVSVVRTVAVGALLLTAACGDSVTEPSAEPEGGNWATWVLQSGADIVVPPPPQLGSATEQDELTEIKTTQASLDLADNQAIARWEGPPTMAWQDELLDRFTFWWVLLPDVRVATPVRSARIAALMNVAIYDAMVATWHAKYQYRRAAPHRRDSGVNRLVPYDGAPSYPSEHAAAAAAAAAILTFGFPGEDSTRFQAMALEAGESRIAAGAAYRSDVEAGFALGREVAARVIAYARTDGSDQPWIGTIPEGPDKWKPTPPRRVPTPFDPGAGSWKPWVLPSGDFFRPPPHPAFGSAAFLQDLNELVELNTTRTVEQADIARYWATDPPESRWLEFTQDEIRTRRLSSLRAARAMALVSVAMYDSFIACWDGKFYYWLLRPITADSTIVTVFSNPPFPSYPSGHSTGSAGAAEVLAALFPDRAAHYRERAAEASISRVYASVHYRFDVEAGEELGRKVGELVAQRLQTDGADR